MTTLITIPRQVTTKVQLVSRISSYKLAPDLSTALSELHLLAGFILFVGWSLLNVSSLGRIGYMTISTAWPVFMAIGLYRFRLKIVFLFRR